MCERWTILEIWDITERQQQGLGSLIDVGSHEAVNYAPVPLASGQ